MANPLLICPGMYLLAGALFMLFSVADIVVKEPGPIEWKLKVLCLSLALSPFWPFFLGYAIRARRKK